MPAPTVSLPDVRSARARFVYGALALAAAAAFVLLALNDRSPNAFHAHGYCYLWQPTLVGLLVLSDLSIWLSYTAIAITLAWFVTRGRGVIPFSWVFLAFGGFIVACGMTHFMDVITLWFTTFWLAASVKLVTAIASVATAAALPPLVPRVLALVDAARLSEQRRIELAEAEAASRAKDQLLSVVSHELRTPLNAILGWTVMLKTKPLDDEAKSRALDVIERNAQLQAHLVDDLLDVSRIVSGKMTFESTQVDLAASVAAAAESIRPQAEAKGVRLHVGGVGVTPAVVGDPNRLQQVFWNLLSNAVKFTPAGGEVRVSTSASPTEVQVKIDDTGIGIPADFLRHVFDPFRQHDSSTTRGYGGLGLGLALVRHLVEWHKGQVKVSSAGPGQGATFVVVLPVAGSPEGEDATAS